MAEMFLEKIQDFHDVIRLLEEHPDWQVELRRVLFTKDLLALPEKMVRLTDSLRGLVAAHTRTEQQLATLTDRVDSLTLAQTNTEQHVSTLAQQMSAMTKLTQDLGSDVGTLKGMGLETRLRLSGSPFFGVMLRKPRVLSRSETTDLLDEAEIRGVLTEGEIREVQLADLIVHGTRRADNTPVYLVAEISWTVDSDDVRRAANRASLLAKTGTLSLPVVVGERVEGRAAELAQTLKVWQMTDADVVPPSA
jgi:hypothetical protein